MEDMNNGGALMEIAGEVIAYSPGRSKTVRTNVPGVFTGETEFAVENLGGGRSRFSQNSKYIFVSSFTKLLTPIIMPSASKKGKEDMERLKNKVEAQ